MAHRFYGYRRLTALLKREGWPVNAKKVLRLTREDNLLALRAKTYVPITTLSPAAWNTVGNVALGLVPTQLDRLWVADITYVRLRESFVYLAAILDACSRKVVGWALDEHMRAELPLAALQMAVAALCPAPGTLIHHSDQGVQYTCAEYREALATYGIEASMSRKGNPYDNAKAESFMKTLKKEEVYATDYRDLTDARTRIGSFIEETYNRQRLHSALAYRSPDEYENEQRLLGWVPTPATAA